MHTYLTQICCDMCVLAPLPDLLLAVKHCHSRARGASAVTVTNREAEVASVSPVKMQPHEISNTHTNIINNI